MSVSAPPISDTEPADESSPSRVAAALAWVDQRLEALSDYINPILVKETRQALKSQQFVLWYLLLLAGCWVVTMGGLAVIGPAAYYGAFGGQLFLWYAWILSFPLLVVAPFSAFRSLAAEQEENTRDVLTVSALSPFQVVNGKLGSAALQVAIYLSAMAPCLGFAYLLRGVDALTLLLLPALGVLASLGLSLVGLLLASLTRLRYLQILINVAFITLLLLLFYNCFAVIEEFVDNGFRMYQAEEFWLGLGMIFTAYATTFLLAYFLAVAANTFTSANRSTPLRVAMLVQQSAYIGWFAAVWIYDRDADIPIVMFVFALAYWTFAGMFLTSEGQVLSPRVRRTLPKTALGRQLFTLLSPGPGTGYFFVMGNLTYLMLLTFTASVFSRRGGPSISGVPLLWVLCVALAYAAAYLGLGRIIILLVRRVAELSLFGGFLVHVLLMLAGGSLPFAIEASSSMFRREGFSYLDVPSPVAVMLHLERGDLSDVEAITTGVIVIGAATCLLLVNLVLAAGELRQTRLPLPQRIIEDELAKAARPVRASNPWGDTTAAPPTQDAAADGA